MEQMPIELRSALRRFIFAGACFVFAGLYLYFASRAYIASRLAATPNPSTLNEAIRLEPSNAEYRDLAGRSFSVSGISLGDAIANYSIAVRLNPYMARYWLDLASTYQLEGRMQEQGENVQHAVQADPTTPHVAWEAANFFLIQGELEKALHYFHVVVANDPDSVDFSLLLCWRATGDADRILDQVLPPRPDRYLSFLRLLISKQEVAAAERVWNRLIGLNEKFSTKLAFPYFRFLIAKQEVAAAQSAWQQLAVLDPSLQPYLPSPQNLVVNGGFEENVLNGGFDWWYESNPHAALAIDTSIFSQGSRSLSVTFDGRNPGDAGIAEFVPVKPNTNYEFSVDSRSENIESASGPRVAIVDAYANTPYVLTDDLLGTNPWHKQHVEFRTGPEANLVVLKIVRQPPNPLIRGKIWIDDVRLVEKSN